MSYFSRAVASLRDPLFPYWVANLYGFGKWIRRYGYYPSFLPLCISSTHGAGDNYVSGPALCELNSDAPVQFYNCSKQVERWKLYSTKKCYVMHSPFVFARKCLKINLENNRYGSVFYAAHATSNVFDDNPVERYIQELEKVPSRYKPVKVCLHWNEFRLGHDELYRKAGFEVVTAGDPVDPRFTERFYAILLTAKYAFSNSFGSNALYAVEAGVPFGLYGIEPNYWNESDENMEKGCYTSYLSTDYRQQAAVLFRGLPNEQVTFEQVAFARYYLGVDEGVSRLKMAWLLYKSLGIWLWGKFKKLVSRGLRNST